MKMKKFLATVTAVAMAICMLPSMTVKAQTTPTIECDIKDGTFTINNFVDYCGLPSTSGVFTRTDGDCTYVLDESDDDGCYWICTNHYYYYDEDNNTGGYLVIEHTVGVQCQYCETTKQGSGQQQTPPTQQHNLNLATTTMVGITLDTPNLEYDADFVIAVFNQKNVTPNAGDVVIYTIQNNMYPAAIYNGTSWSNFGDGTLEDLKGLLSEHTVYVIGTIQEPAPPTPVVEESKPTPVVESTPVVVVVDETKLPVEIVKNDKTDVHNVIAEDVTEEAYNLSQFTTIKGFAYGLETAVKYEQKKNETATVKSTEVEVYTGYAYTFGKACIDVFKNSKVDVVYIFMHKGNLFKVTIPAGTDIESLLGENGFAGPLWIGKQLGTAELIK